MYNFIGFCSEFVTFFYKPTWKYLSNLPLIFNHMTSLAITKIKQTEGIIILYLIQHVILNINVL
jgi:hypothetical protein